MTTALADAKTRILNAAGPVFAEKGFRDATVREICSLAGVNLASVNYHFGDKRQLYIATVTFAKEQRIENAPLPDRPQGTPAKVRLDDFIRTMLARMIGAEGAPWESRLMMREVLEPSEACEKLVEQFFRPQFQQLLGCISELAPKMPAWQCRQIGFSVIGQCLHYRVAGGIIEMLTPTEEAEHYRIDQLAAHVFRVTMAALESFQPPTPS